MTLPLSSRIAALFIGALLSLLLPCGIAGARPEDSARDVPIAVTAISKEQVQQSDLAIDVLTSLNAVRTNPNAFARASSIRLRGAAQRDVTEAINFLDTQRPLPPLTFSPALSDIAAVHARDIGVNGLLSHTGSNGSTLGSRARERGIYATLTAEELSFGQSRPEAVIWQLIVDPGVPGRPHRADLFNPLFTLVGVGCAPHTGQGQVCVINLSGPLVRPPPPTTLPPESEGFRFDCPADEEPVELDSYRERMFGHLLGHFDPTSIRLYNERLAAANVVASLSYADPSEVQLSQEPRLTLPRNLGLGFGYCAPPLPPSSSAALSPPVAPPPPSPPSPPSPILAVRYCWFNSKTGKVVPDAPPRGATVDLADPRRAHNPGTGDNFHRGPDGSWVNSKTGATVRTYPRGAEPDLTDPKRNHAHNADTGDNFHRAPCPAAPPP